MRGLIGYLVAAGDDEWWAVPDPVGVSPPFLRGLFSCGQFPSEEFLHDVVEPCRTAVMIRNRTNDSIDVDCGIIRANAAAANNAPASIDAASESSTVGFRTSRDLGGNTYVGRFMTIVYARENLTSLVEGFAGVMLPCFGG